MRIDQIIGGMFSLILVFIIVSRADQVNQLVTSVGSFVTAQTKALQGVGYAGETLIGALKA